MSADAPPAPLPADTAGADGPPLLDGPPGPALLGAVARLLREVLLPQLTPDQAGLRFQVLVAANAVDLAAREWQQAPQARAQAATSLAAIGLADEAALAEALLAGQVHPLDPADPLAAGVLAHLWASTLARVAIDQPAYAPYRDEIAHPPPPL